jgi:hypothetical protein
MTDLSEVFYVCLLSTVSAVVLKLASMAYKSKCRECSVCCIKVIRDVNLEEQEMEFKIKHNVKDNEEEKV